MLIEWFLSLSAGEKWLYGGIFTFVASLFYIVVNQRLSLVFSIKQERHKDRVGAAAAFRGAINIEIIGDLRGHELENLLLHKREVVNGVIYEGEFFKHRRAIHEYRIHLGLIDRFRLDRAWKKYHGGSEKYPNLFKAYCLPVNGPELLKKRLHDLRVIGHKR